MDFKFTNIGNRFNTNNSSRAPTNCRGNKIHIHSNNCSNKKPGTSLVPRKARKKPYYICLSNKKIEATLVADEPSLLVDHLSTQLDKLEREVILYACSAMMNANVVNLLVKNLNPLDFSKSKHLLPTLINPAKYTIMTTGDLPTHQVIDQAKKKPSGFPPAQ